MCVSKTKSTRARELSVNAFTIARVVNEKQESSTARFPV